jgi:hypothetical protein
LRREKWQLTKQIAPEIAQEVEILKIKRDIVTQEAIAAVAQEKALALRHWANGITASAIRKAAKEGRSSVSGIRFEVCG